MLQLAEKYDIAPAAFHASMVTAQERGKGKCGKFAIELRQHGDSSCVYMYSFQGKPLGQAEISNQSIEKLRRLPENFTGITSNHKRESNSSGLRESSIRDLKFGLKGVSFKAHVVKKSDVRAVTSKDGNPLLVCSVTLSDGTGEIPLAIWNNQINTVYEGDLVEIRDARVRSFRGEIQLSLNRKTGALTVLQPAKKPLPQITAN
jgi:nitrogenase subunit NifH